MDITVSPAHPLTSDPFSQEPDFLCSGTYLGRNRGFPL